MEDMIHLFRLGDSLPNKKDVIKFHEVHDKKEFFSFGEDNYRPYCQAELLDLQPVTTFAVCNPVWLYATKC